MFDITNVTVNKGRALSLLSRYYGVKLEHTIAIGDGFNDVPMFKVAGVSVAVGNASDAVKKHATIVLKKTNKQGGVGEYINRFLDNPEKEMAKSAAKAEKMAKYAGGDEE
ncbi:UNVERIFIED_CONTAM: HAD-IIB family hydrolase [Campylobacter lari]